MDSVLAACPPWAAAVCVQEHRGDYARIHGWLRGLMRLPIARCTYYECRL